MALLDISSDGTRINYHEEDGKIVLDYQHPDHDALFKANAEARATNVGLGMGGHKSVLGRHVMRVPISALMKVASETGLDFLNADDAKKILKIFQGAEYNKLHTFSGRY